MSIDSGDDATWTWTGSNPDHWSMQASGSSGGPYSQVYTVTGSSRGPFGLDSGLYWVMIGKDSGGADVTAQSNEVLAP